jgi:hypothetical protein
VWATSARLFLYSWHSFCIFWWHWISPHGFVLARQVLYHWSHSMSWMWFLYFWLPVVVLK